MHPQNIKSFSSLIPSYRLKVTKFLGDTSQFEFLVMTEKNIFAYKLFLSLIISNFNFFWVWKLQRPPEKSYPIFPNNPSLKVEVLSSHNPLPPLLLKIWLDVQPHQQKGGGVHYA